MTEPSLAVGLLAETRRVSFELTGTFEVEGGGVRASPPSGTVLDARSRGGGAELRDAAGTVVAAASTLRLTPLEPERSSFLLRGMTVGVRFHWQHEEDLRFEGALVVTARDGRLEVVNEVPLERYLVSVISSEMSARAPGELLRAHAVISRSWLLAQLAGRGPGARGAGPSSSEVREVPGEGGKPTVTIQRWYDREDHAHFDICADDHCQRYHGITRAASAEVERAVEATRGLTLTCEGAVCDARFSKCCGGMTELFSSAWGDEPVVYLQAFPDAPPGERPFTEPLSDERHARAFIAGSPDVWCNRTTQELREQILPDMDQATSDFFRWRFELGQDELRGLVVEKSGIDPGPVLALEAVERGPSARIVRLCVEGEQKRLVVGKELEVRRLLSPTHLKSSAFTVSAKEPADGIPTRFMLVGAGWGHGVGLCQIGAAVMAHEGRSHEEILKHYYRGAELTRRYE